jgi:hypothetical protein
MVRVRKGFIMAFETEKLSLEDNWFDEALRLLLQTNLIVISPGNDDLQWFGSFLAQYAACKGSTEIGLLYGNHINNLDDYCYQLCRSIPWGFEMGRGIDAVNDVLRNYNTFPDRRLFFWFDVQHLAAVDPSLCIDLIEAMNGVSAEYEFAAPDKEKEVLQRNCFMFTGGKEKDIAPFMKWNGAFWSKVTGQPKPKVSILEILPERVAP